MGGSRDEHVEAIYRCFNEDRLDGLDGLIAEHSVLVQDPSFPDARTWQGPEGVKRWFSQIASEFGRVEIRVAELLHDSNRALAIVDVAVSGRASGAEVSHRMAHLWTFGRHGVEECRFYLDVDAARAEFRAASAAV